MPFIRAFSIDYRSLRLFRVCLGIGLILQAIHLLPAVRDFLSDGGLLVRTPSGLSLLHISTQHWFLLVLLFALAACGIGMVRNIFPRLSACVAYLILYSIFNRAPTIFYGADQVMRIMLFWSVLLPLGKEPDDKSDRFTNLAAVAVLLQLAMVYFFTGLLKSTDVWLWQGLGVEYALHGDSFGTAFARILEALPMSLKKISSRGVLILERVGPFLFFSPWHFGQLRMILFFFLAIMHILFCMSLHLGLFGIFDIIFLTLLLPGEFWSELNRFRVLKPFRMLVVKDPMKILSPTVQGVAGIFVAVIFFWNLHTLDGFESYFPQSLERKFEKIGFNQQWFLFAPAPSPIPAWWVAEGVTASGKRVNLFSMTAEPPTFNKPLTVAFSLPSSRWLPFIRTFSYRDRLRDKEQLIRYFCEKWNALGQERLESLTLWRILDLEIYPTVHSPSKNILLGGNCSETKAQLER